MKKHHLPNTWSAWHGMNSSPSRVSQPNMSGLDRFRRRLQGLGTHGLLHGSVGAKTFTINHVVRAATRRPATHRIAVLHDDDDG